MLDRIKGVELNAQEMKNIKGGSFGEGTVDGSVVCSVRGTCPIPNHATQACTNGSGGGLCSCSAFDEDFNKIIEYCP